MTRSLEFLTPDWYVGPSRDPRERDTLTSLKILAGPGRVAVTEVEDTIARSVREHVFVPAFSVARWLLANFWRLRWEPFRSALTPDWFRCHAMAAIDGDHAWPGLVFASDGEFVQLRLKAEAATDVAAIRYLRDVTIEVPATDFEHAVTDLVDRVEARLSSVLPGERDLGDLRAELAEERTDPELAASCRLQALAGLDPGSAPEEWLTAARGLAGSVGEAAADELLAVAPALPDGIIGIESALTAMREAAGSVRLDWAKVRPSVPSVGEPPWCRGERLAAELRAQLGIAPGPVPSSRLEELLDVRLPLQRSARRGSMELTGGYRNGRADGRTTLLVPSGNPQGQRFFLARLLGAVAGLPDDDHVLPVTRTGTALQKLERAFAAEFLCPWRDLDAFTDELGTDDDTIAEAADHFDVSELVVLSSLVNKGKVSRSRLVRGE